MPWHPFHRMVTEVAIAPSSEDLAMSNKHMLVEQWKCKPLWLAKPLKELQDFIVGRTKSMESLASLGIRSLGWGHVDHSAKNPVKFDFWAIWQMDSSEAVHAFLDRVNLSGWYAFFEQLNGTGAAMLALQALNFLIHTVGVKS